MSKLQTLDEEPLRISPTNKKEAKGAKKASRHGYESIEESKSSKMLTIDDNKTSSFTYEQQAE